MQIQTDSTPPKKIALSKNKQDLKLQFGEEHYVLSAELLRVLSPSAEVQGHSPEQKLTVLDKEHVKISAIETQGHYAIKLVFDDGHDSGIYSWAYLRKLCMEKEALWKDYLADAEMERAKREGTSAVKWT